MYLVKTKMVSTLLVDEVKPANLPKVTLSVVPALKCQIKLPTPVAP